MTRRRSFGAWQSPNTRHRSGQGVPGPDGAAAAAAASKGVQ
ncbi:hypothetical protein G647_07314 [Cladophialophora carrionii CBS 160.54]|uniref:Uncharacterized protein n=1 Tax=Cladophialophora carrionii CBS 160.54 TaxID=1279043 RepID=V9D2W9_9EURO|nr:uncharacterized protein G647_07314 [Cladophialophora carrionii CBS 160.54]ETI20971.1 hypothetical protein G647_07314 [Cladophialophora carrionii CBS 160.54]